MTNEIQEPAMARSASKTLRTRGAVAMGAAIVATALAGLSGVAYAFWTSAGSGTGTATTASAIAMTVTGDAVTGVYPNEKTTATVHVTNTNPYPVTLSSITLDSVTPTGTGCAATDISLDSTATNVSGSTYTITGSLTKASGATPSAQFNVPIAIGDLANTCQGAGHSFSLSFTVHGQSS